MRPQSPVPRAEKRLPFHPCRPSGNPFCGTAVPFWGQTTWNLSGLSPKRDSSPKGLTPQHPAPFISLLPHPTLWSPRQKLSRKTKAKNERKHSNKQNKKRLPPSDLCRPSPSLLALPLVPDFFDRFLECQPEPAAPLHVERKQVIVEHRPFNEEAFITRECELTISRGAKNYSTFCMYPFRDLAEKQVRTTVPLSCSR